MNVPLFNLCVYRSPAVCYEKVSHTLLIFAELKGSAGQTSAKLIMKRGVLEKGRGELRVQWKEVKAVKEAHLDGHRSMNPCPVFDEKKQKLFLFFTCVEDSYTEERQKDISCNRSRLCYVSSEDLGENWSKVTDLTGCLPEHCVTFSVGSGHGLQTENGRLIVPAHVYMDAEDVDGEPAPHAVPLFSDNGGESWQFGSVLPEISTKCQMAEVWVDGGRFIYCNASDEQGGRLEAFSDDNGDTFTMSGGGKLADTPPGCQGGVVSFPDQDTAAAERDASQIPNSWLLFSQPISRFDRMDLSLFVNKTPSDPKAWSKPWFLKGVSSGQSDLTYIDDGFFTYVFEENINQLAIRTFHFSEIKLESPVCRIQ